MCEPRRDVRFWWIERKVHFLILIEILAVEAVEETRYYEEHVFKERVIV
jgi:hypothetical protein